MQNKKLKLKCKNCGIAYTRYKANNRPQKFCSRKCYLGSQENSETQRRRMTEMRGEKNYGWIGDKIRYKSLHRWVELQLGKSKNYLCQFCKGKSGSTKMNWSNIDHTYTRDLSKWIPLCKICHSQHDQGKFRSYSGPKSELHRKNISKSRLKNQ